MNPITAEKVRISGVGTVRMGSPFRERIVHDPSGAIRVVQGKDIASDGTLDLSGMVRVTEVPGKGEPDVLRPGDVVLQTRGSSYRAAIVPRSDAAMVAAGSLYILAPDVSRIDPEYLVFFLSLPTTQATLRQLATGSTILNLRRSAVEHLEVPLPNLSDQRRLVELGRLTRKQSEIAQRLNQLRLQELHVLARECAKKAGGAATPPAPNRSERRGKRPQALS
jgi:restriction endonuclease S subunit